MMKRLIPLTIALLATFTLWAQDDVNFEFSDGIEAGAVKTKMEQGTSRLLTAINRAERTGGDINYSGIDIDNLASQSIGILWNNVHFRISDDDIVEHCLRIKTSSGSLISYQVRNIAIEMKPLDNSYEGDTYQEICINYDKTGRITDFNIAMGLQQYSNLMRDGLRLDDMDRRMQILHWVEQFRNAYVQKDLQFMDAVFSEDALIVTGKVIKRLPGDGMKPVAEVEYTSMCKQQYLKNLKGVFQRNGYINVKFDDITIVRHPTKKNFYGVTLKQGWFTKTYHDEGIVFIVWDFSDELHPKILVRTWQPMEVNEGDVFTLNSFKFNE